MALDHFTLICFFMNVSLFHWEKTVLQLALTTGRPGATDNAELRDDQEYYGRYCDSRHDY